MIRIEWLKAVVLLYVLYFFGYFSGATAEWEQRVRGRDWPWQARVAMTIALLGGVVIIVTMFYRSFVR